MKEERVKPSLTDNQPPLPPYETEPLIPDSDGWNRGIYCPLQWPIQINSNSLTDKPPQRFALKRGNDLKDGL